MLNFNSFFSFSSPDTYKILTGKSMVNESESDKEAIVSGYLKVMAGVRMQSGRFSMEK